MKRQFYAVVDTGAVDMNGDQLSPRALQQLAVKAPGSVISMNFDPLQLVGIVHGSQISDFGVTVDGEIDDALLPDPPGRQWYVVPGFQLVKTHKNPEAHAVFDEIDMVHFAVTDRAADPNLTPLEWREEP